MILLFALILRLLGLWASPLWYDEILSLQRAGMPIASHLQVHVNLWEIMLRAFANPIAIRIPALACSMLALVLAGRVMHLLGLSRWQRTVGMITIAAMPGLLWMAQDARYYAGISLVYMASLYYSLTGNWLGLIAVSGISFFIHPTAPAYMVPAWVLSIWSIRWDPGVRYAFGAFGLFVVLRVIGIADRSTFWLEESSPEYLARQFALAIGAAEYNMLPAAVFAGIVLALGVYDFNPRALAVFLLPVAAIVAVSVLVVPVGFYRTFQPALMGLGILVGSVTDRKIVPVILMVLLGWMLAQYDPTAHAGHIERGAEAIRSAWHPEDCIRYGDEFSMISMSLVAADLRTCDELADFRTWTVTTEPGPDPAWSSDGWHFPRIYIFSP